MSHRSRALLGAALTTSAIVAVPATASALTLPPPSGELRLQLRGAAATALQRQGVKVTTGAPATAAGSTLVLPLTSAILGRTTVGTTHAGKIVLTKGSRSIEIGELRAQQGRRVVLRGTIDGTQRTILSAVRKTSRVTVRGASGTAQLRSTHLALTRIGAKAIRQALDLDRLRAGGFAQATGQATRPIAPPTLPQPPAPPKPPLVRPKPPIVDPAPLLGGLEWTQVNAFESSSPPGAPNLNRTWLGYFTASPAPRSANGTFTPSDGAIGDTVTPASPRGIGVSYRTTFPIVSSTVRAAAKTGVVRFDGLVTYASPAPPAGHGITVSIQDPRIELDGDSTAKLYATGLRTGSPGTSSTAIEPYDDSQAVFDLQLPETPRDNGDGTVTFEDVVPAIAATGHTFPSNYTTGMGPDRTPNTFGSFDLTVPAGA